MLGQPRRRVAEEATAEELAGALFRRVAVSTRVVPLAHTSIERRLAPREGGARLLARGVDPHRHSVGCHLHEHGHGQVGRALGRHLGAGLLGSMHSEEILDAHHAPIGRNELREAGGDARHRLLRPPLVAVGTGLTSRPLRRPPRLGRLGHQ